MGLTPRMRVKRLPEKLRKIRENLNLSQGGMLQLLGFEELTDGALFQDMSEVNASRRCPSYCVMPESLK